MGSAQSFTFSHRQELALEWLETVPCPVLDLTRSGQVQQANASAAKFLNIPRESVIGHTLRNQIVARDSGQFSAHLERCESSKGKQVVTKLRMMVAKQGERTVELISQEIIVRESKQPVYRTAIRDITEVKHVETALRDSEAQLRAIMNLSGVGLIRMDLEGRITFTNARFCAMLRYDPCELKGRLLCDFSQGDGRRTEARLFRKLASKGTPFQLELCMIRKDGIEIWVDLHASALLNDRGRPVSAAAVTIDMTERKAAEARLRQSEEQFRRGIEEAPVPVIMHAENGEVLEISKTWTRLTGYSHKNMRTFDAWLTRAYGYGADVVREQMKQMFEKNLPTTQMEVEVLSRDGSSRNWIFHASPVGTLSDGRRFGVGMALDITDRKQAEAALAASREQLRLIIENAREYAIFSIDLERRITSWNIGAERLLGYSEAEVLGCSADIIFTPQDRATGEPRKETKTALKDGRALGERWHVRKDGSSFWGSGIMTPMRDAENQTIGLVKIFRDETEARQTREALERSRAELERALSETQQAREAAEAAGEAKDRFLAILSHELRTPLTPVLMTAHTILRRTDLPAPVRDGLIAIRRNIQLEARLVDDLLDLTRITRGKMELLCEPMDIHEVIKHAVEVCHEEIEKRRQKLSVKLKADNAQIEGDAQRLQQVIWNLLKNASKFTPEGGRIRLQSSNDQDRFVLKMTDSGIGLEADALERIFNPFVQANQRITQRYGGLGLGLAIAKATTEAHGGTLRARSGGLGKGATFTLSLPLAPKPKESP